VVAGIERLAGIDRLAGKRGRSAFLAEVAREDFPMPELALYSLP